MAFRYLIYSTGTTYSGTILSESASSGTTSGEAAYYTDFVIPEIQPLYLWQVDNVTTPTDVIPNTDANISAYLEATAPPLQPEDDASVGFVTGETATKIDKVTGATGNLGTFVADGNLEDSGYAISDLTGGTSYTFVGSGGTQVFETGTNPTTVTIYSTPPTGTTVAWGDITGTLSAQTDLWSNLTWLSGETANKLDTVVFSAYTGTTATEIASKLDTSVFTGYTATTQPVIDAALTGVTNSGSGTTLGGTSGRNVTIKSVSVLGGLSLSGDADNLIISGGTAGSTNWGDINGTLSNQTDLWTTLTGMTAETATKLDTVVFSAYTGTTDTRFTNIENDITYISGVTDTKLNESVFTGYTATTQPVIDAALTGATNGLTASGRDVELGGTLSKDTVVSGLSNNLTFNTQYIKLQAPNGIDIIDTDGVGGVNIESDAGTISLIGNDSGSTEVNKVSISETQMVISDGRGTPVGMEYAGDYSTTFTNESLITKRYADTIAGGLIPKAAVLVASTGETVLSGLTTIDGVAVSNGDRVLVKDNATASENGIYIASASTWTRATDFDGNPDGEVSAGNIIPVLTGATQYSTLWVLVTPNPITVGVTALNFSLFSSPHEMIAGHGITIDVNEISVDGGSLAGSSIAWTGTTGNETYNVDVTTGTVAAALALKLDVSVFDTLTGTTLPATYLTISDFNTFSGTTLPANYYNKTEINTYTGATDTRLTTIESDITYISGVTDTKLNTAVFSAYTGTTAPNEIFLIHTGGTELNTILATAIEWDSEEVSGAAFSWTGSSEIQVLETGLYEVSYNIPYNIGTNSQIGVGANIILNNATVIDVTAAAALATRTNSAGSVGLPTVILSLTANDVLNLATFRTSQSGSATSSLTGSILIKRKNTLQ